MEHNIMPIPLVTNQEVTQQLAILSQQMLVLSGQLTKSTPHMPGQNIFLLEWLDSWLVRKKHLVGPKTWAYYECLYRNHVQPAFQNVLLADITAQQVDTKTKSSRRLVVIPQSLSTLLESYHAKWSRKDLHHQPAPKG